MQRLIIILALLAGSAWADTKLSWDKPQPVEGSVTAGYELYIDGGKVADAPADATSYVHAPAVTPGAKWTAVTVATDGQKSVHSNVVLQPGPTVGLIAPKNVKVTAGDKTVTVSWDAVPGATAYNVVLDGSVIATVKGLSSLRTVPVGKCVVPGNKYAVQAVGGPLSATVSVKGNVCNVSC